MCCSVAPPLVTLSPVIFFLLLADTSVMQEELWEDYKYGRQGLGMNCTWKCILFTMQWPGGFCESLYNETLCRIPETVNNWTIHGLWPLHALDCCGCWHMFHSDIQDLEAELTEYWPSLLKTKSPFQFWKEEWRKHGSCAACVEGFNSPLKYFQICLKLRHQFDIHRLLEAAGISPSCERPYKVAEVQRVLSPHLGDRYEIQCVKDHMDRQVWFQLKVRLHRNLTLGCDHHDGDPVVESGPGPRPSSGHPCPPDAPFFYFPINHQQPQRPCG
ncbi:ribonuclease Oy-like [Melanotaenia boesemani]|uniref:ribonuclease Oy-like n=1 Tax=Melanotaenia boesemani TaxID=1250792 RepID=UPI001C04C1A7|nr:ribonuclease Oy-like [Melanotaenia boesemani]XP_041851158.1 ribonuclease Oy-like [Melanotaenia boesemani]XP_041851159.1 ribonuclease Oy-like [Melanotaenia boesemani]XP_041851160.1 ribonuclease Oy-like [Melanotaenia boesemani]